MYHLSEFKFINKATRDFITCSDPLKSLLGADHNFFSIEKAIEGKKSFSIESRKIIVEHLQQQYAGIKLTTQEKSNIDSILNENTFTVTTGQQLHLFFGPTFFIYKLFSVIHLANELKNKFTQYNFVPVFWLASEDHDLQEIQNTKLFGKDYLWNTEQTGATGNYNLDGVVDVLNSIKDSNRIDKQGLETIEKLSAIYQNSDNLSDATIKLIHEYFGNYGLISIDANNSILKKQFSEVMQQELFTEISKSVVDSFSAKLKSNGYALQTNARPINLFYLKGNIRERVVKEDGNYNVLNTSIQFTPEQLKDEILLYPERFSPNALLRPLYQERILPNVAFVAGNAEINYWLQLAPLFSSFQLSSPALFLRNSVWIGNSKTQKIMEKYSISFLDFFNANSDTEILDLISKSGRINLEDEILQFEKDSQSVKDKIAKIEPSQLSEFILNSKQYRKMLGKLNRLITEAQNEKQLDEIQLIQKVKSKGFVQNNIQEREIYTLEGLINNYNFIEKVAENVNFTVNNANYIVN